jgi:hypothetical protein
MRKAVPLAAEAPVKYFMKQFIDFEANTVMVWDLD